MRAAMLDRRMGRRRFTSLALAAPALAAAGNAAASVAIPGDGTGGPRPTDELYFPDYRLLAYYGYPGEPLMGILGEYSKEDLLPLLQQQGEAYQALDPSKPVKLAYEVIGSVAQRDPGADGNYLASVSEETLNEYIEFTAANDLMLIIDCQFGRNSVEQELDAFMPFLVHPHVHIALDPEFHVAEGEVPGEVLGTIDAADITYAQERLAKFAQENGLPAKILIVHQFNWYSISNRETIKPVDWVQFVLEIDGWGDPDLKRETYRVLSEGGPIEFQGFKLWYTQDVPLMTESEVLALDPVPDLVIYQ